MKGIMIFNIVISLMISFCQAESFDRYSVKDNSTITKELSFTGLTGSKTVDIDNVFGAITVTGYNGTTAKFTIQKTIHANSQDALQRAQQEVTLDISTEGNTIALYVDGPFRDHKKHVSYDERRQDYMVQYDFQVQVPHNTSLYLKTVNEGDITVKDIEGECTLKNVNGSIDIDKLRGDFDVSTVNGKVIMNAIDGSGDAHTVNGKINLQFSKNPASHCSFKSVNGDLELVFLPDLSADFNINTFNGKIYNAFSSGDSDVSVSEIETRHGKHKFHFNQRQEIRIGQSGPEIDLKTLNGDISLSK